MTYMFEAAVVVGAVGELAFVPLETNWMASESTYWLNKNQIGILKGILISSHVAPRSGDSVMCNV